MHDAGHGGGHGRRGVGQLVVRLHVGGMAGEVAPGEGMYGGVALEVGSK